MDLQHSAKLRELRGELARYKKERGNLKQRIHMLETECAALRSANRAHATPATNDERYLFYECFLERFPGVLAVLDTNLDYLFGTDAEIRRLLSFPPHLLVEGISFANVRENSTAGAWMETLEERCNEAMLSGKTLSYMDSAVSPGGTHSDLSINIMPALDKGGILCGVIIHIQTFTVRDHSLHDIESALAGKNAHLERVAFELRSLISMVGDVSRQVGGEQSGETGGVRDLRSLREKLGELERGISKTLMGEGRSVEAIERPYFLRELLKDAVIAHVMRASKMKLHLLSDVDPALPASYVGDSLHIKQVLISLIATALTNTTEGYVSLAVNGTPVDDENYRLSFTVSHTGNGIPADLLEGLEGDTPSEEALLAVLPDFVACHTIHMMKAVFRAKNLPEGGAALTITLPQRVMGAEKLAELPSPEEKHVLLYGDSPVLDSIALMLGRLSVRYTRDTEKLTDLLSRNIFSHAVFPDAHPVPEDIRLLPHTTKLALLRPVHSANEDLPYIADSLFEPVLITDLTAFLERGDHRDYREPEAPRSGAVRALVVDDNEINLIVAAEMLSQFDIVTETAESGLAALEMVSSQDYDIIFMDHLMLGMDGVETTLRLRALPGRAATIPVIALTANASMGARDYFLQNGMNDYLAKPIELPQLLGVLEKWLPGWMMDDTLSPSGRDDGRNSAFLRDLRTKLGLDVDAAMSRIGESEEAYINVLGAFARTTAQKMGMISQAVKERDWESFRVGIHGQKSSLANIGAVSLSQDARNLEQAVLNKNYSYAEGLALSFCQQVNSLALQIAELEPSKEDSAALPEARPGDLERLYEGLARTQVLIEGLDADTAARVLRGLAARRYDPDIDRLLAEMRRALELFDYNAAEACLAALLSKNPANG